MANSRQRTQDPRGEPSGSATPSVVSRRHRELVALNQIAEAANSSLQIEEILYLSLDRLLGLMELPAGWIHLLDRDTNVLQLAASRGAPKQVLDAIQHLHVGEGLAGLVAETGQPIALRNLEGDHRLRRGVDAEFVFRSFAAVPLVCCTGANRVVGVLSLVGHEEQPLVSRDLAVLTAAGRSIGIAVEHARLYQLSLRRTRELEALHAVSRAAASAQSVPELLHMAAEALAKVLGLKRALVFLFEPDLRQLRPVAGVNVEPERATQLLHLDAWSVGRQAIESRRAIFDPDAVASGLFAADDARRIGITGVLVVPIVSGEHVLGVFGGDWGGDPALAGPDELTLAESLASQVATALQNARLQEHARELAVLEERNRLAREIHDTLVQGLTAIALHLEAASSMIAASPERARRSMNRALTVARTNLEEARRSVLDLRPAPLHGLALPDALRSLLDNDAEECGWQTALDVVEFNGRLPARLEVGLYRIAQEVLSNARKHAFASHVGLSLRRTPTEVIMVVADDGRGFDLVRTTTSLNRQGGFGLVGIHERAKLLGGSVHIDTAPGQGAAVTVRLPIAVNSPDSNVVVEDK